MLYTITNKSLIKNKNFILICFVLLSNLLFAQQNIDFGKLNTLQKVNTFFYDKSNKSDYDFGNYKTYEKGFWNEIPIENIILHKNSLEFSAPSSLKNSTKKISEYLAKNNKESLIINKHSYETVYTINTEDITLNFRIDIEEEQLIAENTKANMVISFKKSYDNPLAKISTSIKINSAGTEYFLDLDFFQVSPKVFINGIPIYQKTGENRFMNDDYIYLNRYILNSKTPITLKFILEPGNDENDKPYKSILKESYFKAILESNKSDKSNLKTQSIYNNQEYVTDTIVEDGRTRYSSYPGTYNYGKDKIEFEYTFTPQVDYDIKGWSNGKDLRTEKDLEQKIKKFYTDFGDLIINKNIDKISELLYDRYFEFYTSNYNYGKTKSYDDYDDWLFTLNSSFKTILAKNTKLHISNDGKLAYLESLDKASNLKVVGKEYVRDIDFMFYIDEKTNQLKIVR